jgi:hypothetical protein
MQSVSMFPLSPHNYFEIAALLVSLLFYGNLRKSFLKWLPVFLLFIVAVELTGRYINKELHLPNFQLYNLSIPIEYLFFGSLFYNFFKRKFYKLIAKGFLIIFIVFSIFNFTFIEGNNIFNTNFLKAGSFGMIVLSCLFFIEILKLDVQVNPLRQPKFWMVTGIFLFNIGEFVSNAFSHVFFFTWQKWMASVREINHSLIFVLYSCFIIAIICSNWSQEET